MNRDRKVLYIVSLIIFAALLGLLLVDIKSSRIATALLLLPLSAAARLFIKKRGSVSINKKEVLLLVIVIGAIFVILLHMSGMYFGYYQNPYFVSTTVFLKYVLPITSIIVTSELIRSTILTQKQRGADIICFLSCILIEILTVSNIAGITSFYRFMDVVGLALFPAVSANIYYHYASKRFGMLPNIAFRAIFSLYTYFIPTTSGMPDALLSCIKIVLPIGMLALIAALYEKRKKNALKKNNVFSKISVVLTTAVIISVAMLISCQFRYGAIVIATESMTGEINKGDVIIYERYDDQTIKEGQVIVFLNNNAKIVHRVVDIQVVGGETRYYTKGDANDGWDTGYRTEKDIFALTDTKVAYIGYPTLLLRNMIKVKI